VGTGFREKAIVKEETSVRKKPAGAPAGQDREETPREGHVERRCDEPR